MVDRLIYIILDEESYIEYITEETIATFTMNIVTDVEVAKIIGSFNDSATGWDDLRPKIIKDIKNDIKLQLTHICNLSFTSGVFPTELKLANVVPIYKANDEMVFSNYRPVSVLPVLSKLLERLMYNRLICYINANRLLYKLQFGFQKRKSTEMSLIVLMDHISEALGRGECVIGVFLDFSKAFDTVDHSILKMKLNKYGIKGTQLKWYKDLYWVPYSF